jgi:flavin reductase (DIM6/NTAB) family NADH-FMN oxidoreductase RutF
MKKILEPNNAMYLLPAVLVTCCDSSGKDNIITIAWTTNICRKPPCLSIVISGEKYSTKIIKDTKEFVLNIPGAEHLKEVDICGQTHGDKVDKFELANFTKKDALLVKPKLIKECPINMECKLKDLFIIEDSHLFIGEVLKVHIDENLLDSSGKINYLKLNPILYGDKSYWSIREKIGYRGFSQKI